ncbi:unnamed protein product [Rhizophagus irregularis]|nr:unnamed protein product [Rhizophagus irregularis]
MSCSKIFLGDLPEIVYGIIKNFQNDYTTLHSCVLVNRLWCRLAIPLLWENPFSTPTGNYNFIEVYLYNLNDCLKTKINDYQIIDHLLPSNTLFNYPSFIRYLDIFKITHYIEMWLETNDKTSNLVFQSVYEFKELISMSLIKLFIDNEINLHTLKITISTNFIVYINNILEIILKNPNLINNIKNLEFSILTSNTLIEYRISQIINSHQNLKRILLGNGNNELILQNLGQILPSRLEYLSLVLHIKTSDFEVFLKNSQNTLVEKLVINNMVEGLIINILPYIKEHIMKKKRVKYLAIKTTLSIIDFNRNDEDLFDSKEQVKEFKLHNIKVLKYANLSTGIYRFVNEID